MVVSHTPRCIFVHVPKAAGSSFDKLLQAPDSAAVRAIPGIPSTDVPAKGKHTLSRPTRRNTCRGTSGATIASSRSCGARATGSRPWYHMCVQRPVEEYRRSTVDHTHDFADFVVKCQGFQGRPAMIGFNQVEYAWL